MLALDLDPKLIRLARKRQNFRANLSRISTTPSPSGPLKELSERVAELPLSCRAGLIGT
jgi:hypothetical protein